MRFTARRRNVVWRDDPVTQRSVEALLGVLRDDPLVAETRLAAGQGLVCNNVLHDRSAFVRRRPAPLPRPLRRSCRAGRECYLEGDEEILWRESASF